MSAERTSLEGPRLVFREARSADDLTGVLRKIQLLILEYPRASQALFRALVAEGRAFAQTPEGRDWAARLASSDLMRRGRMVWDVTTLRALDDDPRVEIPSVLVDAFVKVTAVDALEPLLSRLFERTLGGSD